MRPNYVRVRKVCPDNGIWWAMKGAWWERKIPTLEQSRSIFRQINQSTSTPTLASPAYNKMKLKAVVPSNITHFEEHSNGDKARESAIISVLGADT